jgi:hypothetical protein
VSISVDSNICISNKPKDFLALNALLALNLRRKINGTEEKFPRQEGERQVTLKGSQ